MTYSRIGVVTGANKGIGLAIVRQLALQYPSSPLNSGPFLIYLTARNKERGEAALKSLEQDTQLKEAKALKAHGGLSEIKYHQLDITDNTSISTLVEDLKKEHEEGIDFIINNAGIALDGFNSDVVKTTLHSNYTQTLHICHTLLPHLKPTGRIVNVASMSGHLNKYSPSIQSRFLSATTESEITSILDDFSTAVESGTEKDAGFPSAAYAVSKAGLIGATKALARKEEEMESKRLVNACCPGYVNTDMTKGNGVKTPDQGAMTPVLLAIGDVGGRSGGFWQGEREIEW